MVGLDLAVFEGLLLLVGTSAAWHDSHHGWFCKHTISAILIIKCVRLTIPNTISNCISADLAPEWPDYLDTFKAELRHPR